MDSNENGEYYVKVTDDKRCINTSEVITYLNTRILSNSLSLVEVYPNPTSSRLIINTSGSPFKAELFDLLESLTNTSLDVKSDISTLVNGIYILLVQIESSASIYRNQK